MQSCYLAL